MSLSKGKSDYVTALNKHQGLPISHRAKPQILIMACRALQGLPPRNLSDLIVHPSLLAHCAGVLFLEHSPPEVQVRPTAPSSSIYQQSLP